MMRYISAHSPRRLVGIAAAGIVVATTVLVAPAAMAQSYQLQGVVTGPDGQPTTAQVVISMRSTKDDDQATLDEGDGYYYDASEWHTTDNGTGHYAVSLAPGTYRVDYFVDPDGDTPGQDYNEVVEIKDQDVTVNAAMKQALTCTGGSQTGSAVVGQTLTAVPGAFDPGTYQRELTYQWWRYSTSTGFVRIDGARDASYILADADKGFQVEVDVTGLSAYGYAVCDWTMTDTVTDATSPTSPTAPTSPGTTAQGAPGPLSFNLGTLGAPQGRGKVGATLVAPGLRLPAGTTVSYQWYRVSTAGHSRRVVPIAAAHRSSYRLRPGDKGASVFVRVVVSAPGYVTAAANSARVSVSAG